MGATGEAELSLDTDPVTGPPKLELDQPIKPRFRGRLHQCTFWASLPAGAIVIAHSNHAASYVAAALYAASMSILFGTSAAYHRGRWTSRARNLMQRLDHAMIFVLIAGSYTPITLLALRPGWGITMLSLVWTLAVAGATLTLVKFEFVDKHGGYLYVALGWMMVIALPVIVHSLSTGQLILLATGGVLYTVGAINFGREWPVLRPRTFGYHEVWHVMTVLAAGCHYALVLSLVRA